MSDQIDNLLKVDADREVGAERMAHHLTKDRWLRLMLLAGGLFAGGTVLALWQAESMTFARTGALITCLSLVHGFVALRYSTLEAPSRVIALKVRTEIERNRAKDLEEPAIRALAQGKVDAVVPRMFAAVARRFAAQNLIIAAAGTLVWGFGDLVPFDTVHGLIFR